MNETSLNKKNSSVRIALIPAYEPDDKMISVARGLKDEGFDVVIVDDGSGTMYSDVFDAASEYAHIISYEENVGKGHALKTGLEYIAGNYETPFSVVCVDADGQHKVDDAARICDCALSSPGTLILGSRKFTGKVPLRSRFGNTVTRFVFRMSSGVKVYDTQTGLRAFTDDMIPYLLDIPGERYEYEMNMLMTFARDKKPIREEWIETVYLDDNSSTHFDTIRDSYSIYKEILKFSGSSLVGFCVDYLMYCILVTISGNIVFSNISARVVSASVNYTINRNVVFKSRSSVLRSALSYAALAVFILACNTLLLKYLTGLGLNRYLIKIPVEIIMFALSWFIQHKVIFKD